MKKIILSLMATGLAGLLVSASAQPAPGDDNTNTAATDQPVPPPDLQGPPDNGGPPDLPPDNEPPPETTNAAAPAGSPVKPPLVITPSRTRHMAPQEYQSPFLPPAQASGTNTDDLNLDFSHAPLEMVLHYLSDAAGFIIVQDARVSTSATVTVQGKHLTRDEAVNLLNSVLNQNGYAAIRDGRTLTILDKNDAKTRDIPVKTGNNPGDVPNNDEIVTQIIPIRFVEARQLVSDLSSFVSPQATVVANEAGNSIVVTDTQSNIRHLMEIIQAVDNSAEAETEIRVFRLKYANPTDVASELGNVFPSSTSGNTAQSPIRFGGGRGPGGFFARMMANANNGANGSNDRIKKATQVTAVADARIQAVIVTAPKDLMDQIANMMTDLDVPSDRDQNVYVFQTKNSDPQQVAQVLQNMFSNGTTSRGGATGASANSALMQREQNNNTTMGSTTGNTMGTTGVGGRTGGAGGARF